ncbi:hypothetical protein BS17DRAFT_882560 [Gyrodon lividus]|nr:hypothetical protein BS17DRAFT_882560 [Gyrodon lividus]
MEKASLQSWKWFSINNWLDALLQHVVFMLAQLIYLIHPSFHRVIITFIAICGSRRILIILNQQVIQLFQLTPCVII